MGERSRNCGTQEFFGENRSDAGFLQLDCKLCEPLRRGFSLCENAFHALLLKIEVPAEISKSGVAGDEEAPFDIPEARRILSFKNVKLSLKKRELHSVRFGILRVRLRERFGNVPRFDLCAREGEPEVRVIRAVFGNFIGI